MATVISKPVYRTIGGASPAGSGRPGHRPETTYMVREPPVVYPYDDAVVHHSFKGDQFEGTFTGGVYMGLEYETTNSGMFILKPGFGSIWGRQFEITENYEIDMSSLTGTKYCVIYIEIDLEDFTTQSALVKLVYAGANYPDVESDNLIVNKSGVARMVLYSFLYTASGHDFANVTAKFYRFTAGVAERARMMSANGIWNGRIVSNLFYYNADRFKKGTHAVYADLVKAIGKSGNWKAYSDQLEIKSDDESLPRQLLKITRGEFHLSGTINENSSSNFYYSREENPIPANAQVIGVLISGTMSVNYYEEALFSRRGWKKMPGNQYFSAQHHLHDTKIFGLVTGSGHVPAKEGQAMFDGNVWNKGLPLWVSSLFWQADHLIGVETGERGVVLWNPNQPKVNVATLKPRSYSYDMRGRIATLNFSARTHGKPCIEVSVGDNYQFIPDLHVRLIYIQGAEAYGPPEITYIEVPNILYPWFSDSPTIKVPWSYQPKTISDGNPFSSLNPTLEGGQT